MDAIIPELFEFEMNNASQIIRTEESLCRECFACVRICPVKAIKVVKGHTEVVDEKCIFCGLCVVACSQNAKRIESEKQKVLDLLSKRRAVAILASEAAASFHPLPLSQVRTNLLKLGFIAVEDTVLAEEIVAEQYLRLCRESNNLPIIRSSCPVVVEFLLKYHPRYISHLAPIASPKLMQSRLVKAMYPGNVATVCITACPGRKAEARDQTVNGTIDAVLTFGEAKELFVESQLSLNNSNKEHKQEGKPFLARTVSVTGGFPREIVASRTLMDKDTWIVRGINSLEKLIRAISEEEVQPRLIDALACNSCIEGPEIDTDLSVFARKKIIENSYREQADNSATRISFNDIYRSIPQVDRGRTFTSRKLELPFPSEPELEGILASAEKNCKEEMLDCGACGYESCRDTAIAVYQGFNEWSSCLFFQRKLFLKVINRLKETAITDGLTQLANHRHFSERLSLEFKRAKRYNSPLSVVMIDIDFFKLINDNYGHQKGDEVLRNIARIIKENVRETDLPARYGGDEFSLILPETGRMQAYSVAEKLRKKVEDYILTVENLGDLTRPTISVGVAALDHDINDFEGLVEKADKALYIAKQGGRNKTYAAADSSSLGEL